MCPFWDTRENNQNLDTNCYNAFKKGNDNSNQSNPNLMRTWKLKVNVRTIPTWKALERYLVRLWKEMELSKVKIGALMHGQLWLWQTNALTPYLMRSEWIQYLNTKLALSKRVAFSICIYLMNNHTLNLILKYGSSSTTVYTRTYRLTKINFEMKSKLK